MLPATGAKHDARRVRYGGFHLLQATEPICILRRAVWMPEPRAATTSPQHATSTTPMSYSSHDPTHKLTTENLIPVIAQDARGTNNADVAALRRRIEQLEKKDQKQEQEIKDLKAKWRRKHRQRALRKRSQKRRNATLPQKDASMRRPRPFPAKTCATSAKVSPSQTLRPRLCWESRPSASSDRRRRNSSSPPLSMALILTAITRPVWRSTSRPCSFSRSANRHRARLAPD